LAFGGSALLKFSICDQQCWIFTKRQLQNGVVDAYTHVLEQYLTYPWRFYKIALPKILQTLIQVGPE
jgi:NADP-dependent alcohol dehydrogenase